MKRRALLTSIGVTGVACLAGCSALNLGGESTQTEQSVRYPALKSTPVYFGPDLTGTLPEYASVSDDPEAAVVAVVDHETPLDPSRLVDWLLAGVAVGTIKRPAAEALGELLVDGNVSESFEASIITGSDPNDIAVVRGVGGRLVSSVATYGRSIPETTRTVHYSFSYMINDIVEAVNHISEAVNRSPANDR
ncbi:MULTISPECIES: hypothetical protein [Salinibaculum]|uniref:hypothetical protein n=1 Tax=Salinibaculum TaxID=2732368 RepID=UPI0030D359FA